MLSSNHPTIDRLPKSPEFGRMRGDFPPVPRMADISDGFTELRCNAVPERERGFCEKRKYLKLLCSIQKFQMKFLTETEVLMKCR